MGRRTEKVSYNSHSSHEGFGHGERKMQVLRSCRRRRLLQFVHRGHHGQGPQPLLRRTAKEAPPTGAAQALRSLHSTQALPITLCVQLYADPFQQIPGRQSGLAFALRDPRRPGNCPQALPSPCAIIVMINDNRSCRSCCLTREGYRKSSSYCPLQPRPIPPSCSVPMQVQQMRSGPAS